MHKREESTNNILKRCKLWVQPQREQEVKFVRKFLLGGGELEDGSCSVSSFRPCFEGNDWKKGRQLFKEKSAPQRKSWLRLMALYKRHIQRNVQCCVSAMDDVAAADDDNKSLALSTLSTDNTSTRHSTADRTTATRTDRTARTTRDDVRRHQSAAETKHQMTSSATDNSRVTSVSLVNLLSQRVC